MQKPYFICITGGIASGKSYILNKIKEKGFKTLSLDLLVKKLQTTRVYKNRVYKLFKTTDNKKILNAVLNNKYLLKKLNSLTHPLVVRKSLYLASKLSKKSKNNIVFIEVPLVFEAKIGYKYNCIISVITPLSIRLERLRKRGLDTLAIQKLLKIQVNDKFRILNSDYILKGMH